MGSPLVTLWSPRGAVSDVAPAISLRRDVTCTDPTVVHRKIGTEDAGSIHGALLTQEEGKQRCTKKSWPPWSRERVWA